MIISNNQIRSLIAMYANQDKKDAQISVKGQNKFNEEAYKNSVSSNAKSYLTAKEVISTLPEVREDRLANIRKQVQSGTYEVTDEEVAEKMIGRTLVDKLV
ncbi:flagellar biosynthesis anti-sigma factor FlgM [Phosphitispora sp. TUW77]|uniref:flagellar biosynthesis anti-sigma factor FlgM n=1 Tax=Phosphitispora sp. TUW77 TaxID=3152361 RepID=UPI003AB49537